MGEPTIDLEHVVNRLTKRFEQYEKNGLTAEEIARFIILCVVRLGRVVQAMDNLSHAERRVKITALVRDVYTKLDPDIPFVPSFLEPGIEDMLLSLIVPAVFDAIVDAAD